MGGSHKLHACHHTLRSRHSPKGHLWHCEEFLGLVLHNGAKQDAIVPQHRSIEASSSHCLSSHHVYTSSPGQLFVLMAATLSNASHYKAVASALPPQHCCERQPTKTFTQDRACRPLDLLCADSMLRSYILLSSSSHLFLSITTTSIYE